VADFWEMSRLFTTVFLAPSGTWNMACAQKMLSE
jgi:hypothetical protein